ncbi:hypothetical protein [Actinoplanes subtropicus]|uniref:hypothetical protein n=1 Tax=Actinoplanes subtropicus TaxID=543632 RepID=UPI0004C34F26|nr:hypothetical protein [Actinoplanes subtropicus]
MTTFARTQAARLRDVVVGAVYQAGDAGELVIASVRYTATRPFTGETADAVQRRLAGMAARGAAEREKAQGRAGAALNAAITALATNAVVDRMVDAQLDRVLRPLVRDILDDVLEMLEKEPERLQSLVRGQRDTMVDELVGRIRSGAAAGDVAVDRVTARVLRREA